MYLGKIQRNQRDWQHAPWLPSTLTPIQVTNDTGFSLTAEGAIATVLAESATPAKVIHLDRLRHPRHTGLDGQRDGQRASSETNPANRQSERKAQVKAEFGT